MSDTVDALFGGSPAPVDRLRGLRRLLWVAGILDLLGPFCFLSVPGALLTLWVWQRADEEMARGEADGSATDPARRLRTAAFALLTWSMIAMVAQIVLLGWFMPTEGE